MKQNKFIILAITLFLFSIGATLLYFNTYILIDKKVVPIDFEVVHDKAIGINVDADALHFGKIPAGGGSMRFIVARNQADFDMEVSIGCDAEFKSWIEVTEEQQKFILHPNETEKIRISLKIPKTAEEKIYNGSLIVLFKRI